MKKILLFIGFVAYLSIGTICNNPSEAVENQKNMSLQESDKFMSELAAQKLSESLMKYNKKRGTEIVEHGTKVADDVYQVSASITKKELDVEFFLFWTDFKISRNKKSIEKFTYNTLGFMVGEEKAKNVAVANWNALFAIPFS